MMASVSKARPEKGGAAPLGLRPHPPAYFRQDEEGAAPMAGRVA